VITHEEELLERIPATRRKALVADLRTLWSED